MLLGATQKDSELIPRITRQLWVFLAYVAAARLAILLALPPGYASPIWPAAGIAMAATIAWGPSLIIAVFFGSIATNIRLNELMLHPMDQIPLQLCLALGSSIQAYLGSLIYHALEKRLPNRVSPTRLSLEILLIGPIACITAATIGTASLTTFHVIETPSILSNWVWWWMGDSFGAGVLSPILIRMHQSLNLRPTRTRIAPNLMVAAGLSVLIVTTLTFLLNSHDRRNHKGLEHSVADFHSRIQQATMQAQYHLQMLTELSRTVDPFAVIEHYQSAASPQTIWVPRVKREDRHGFEKAFGNAHQHFTILEKTTSGHLTPAASRSVYWPLIFKTPHEAHLLPPGFDLGTLPEVSQLLQRAWDGSEILASPLITLSQHKKAVLIIKRGLSSKASAFNQGLFISILTLEALIKPALPILNYRAFHIQVKPTSENAEVLYQSWFGEDPSESGLRRPILYGQFQNPLQIGSQMLTLQVDFPASAFNSGRIADSIFITMLCILLAFTLNVLLISQQNTPATVTSRAQAKHDDRLLNYEALRDADRNKAHLLANFSHQIKSPLQGILGLLDMLRGSNLDHKQRSSINTIIANCQSMRLMLDDIHTYATMETGQLNLAMDEFLIEDFLGDLISVYELAAEERQNNFKSQIDLPAKLRVQGDQRKLHRVLSHLLSDAIRRTQKGRISFQVSMPTDSSLTFAIESTRSPQDEVHDNDREFGHTKAYQTLEVFNLKICDRIVQAMGSQLTLERPGPLSSLVKFTLPLPAAALRETFHTSIAMQGHQDVLVVDDNVINLTVAAGLLTKLGYSVDTASDGRDALDKAKQKRYDVIFMDCQMPHMDGYETTQQIRAAYQPERGPVIIALTANALDGTREQALQAGMDSIIIKPISLDILLKTVGYARKMPPSPSSQSFSIMDFKTFSLGLGDDHDLIQMAVIRYFEEIDGIMDRLRSEVERGDATSTAKTAHTLKGMTALFAAQSLVEANRNLEMAGKAGRTQEFAGLLKRIENLTDLLKIELKKMIDDKNLTKKDVA